MTQELADVEVGLARLAAAYRSAPIPVGLHARLMHGIERPPVRGSVFAVRVAAFALPAAAAVALVLALAGGGTQSPRQPSPIGSSASPVASATPSASPEAPSPAGPSPSPVAGSKATQPATSASVPPTASPQTPARTPTPTPTLQPGWAGVVAQACAPAPDFCWEPPSVEIHAGDTVTWSDQSPANHRVQSTSSNWSFNADIYGAGQGAGLPNGAGYTFKAPGTYTYICGIHTYMKGQVIVDP